MAPEREYELYHYTPSLPAAVIFVIAFFALTAIHTYRMTKNRLWFCIPFVVGGLCMLPLSLHSTVRNDH